MIARAMRSRRTGGSPPAPSEMEAVATGEQGVDTCGPVLLCCLFPLRPRPIDARAPPPLGAWDC
jgi:hypothetical protein